MTESQRILLWQRIYRFARVCGGDPASGCLDSRRAEAMAAVERIVDLISGVKETTGDLAEFVRELNAHYQLSPADERRLHTLVPPESI